MSGEEKAADVHAVAARAAVDEVVRFDSGAELEEWAKARLGEAKELHEADKLFAARDVIEAVRASLVANEGGKAGDAAKAALERLEADEMVAEVLSRVEVSLRQLKEFTSDDGWTLTRGGGENATFYRAEEDVGTHSFKCRGVINAPLVNVCAVLLETHLYKLWFPMTRESSTLAYPSRYRKVARVVTKAMWPVADRETVVEGYGVDMLERHMILVNVRSVDEYPGVDIPPCPSSMVRAEVLFGGFLIEPLSRNSCRLQFMTNVDAKLPVIPYAMQNFFQGKIIHVIVSSIEKMATSFHPDADGFSDDELASHKKKNKKFSGTDSPYVACMRENEAVYKYIADSFEGFFKELDAEAAGNAAA